MATACPTNSTECLLRAILDAGSGYNWDPVNFGFTAGFTIIAFLVSVTAMFQSFVAAGPGRLKASERAIGSKQHQQRTDTQFSWKEFRFRTIVNVPVIDIVKVLEYAPTVIPLVNENKRIVQQPAITSRSRVVAGWSQLLNDLSLTDIDFDTIECLTDYTPDDIPAAPAWGRVESIVLLCIMKGCARLTEDEDTGFINATGASAQLSWNMHPTLGPMAVYRTWDIKYTSMHTLGEVQNMLAVFLGELYLNGCKIFRPMAPRARIVPVHFDFMQLKALSIRSWSKCEHQHDHCINRKREIWAIYLASKSREGGVDKETAALAAALFADRPARSKAFPLGVTKMHSALVKMYEEYFPWLIIADDLDDHVLETLCGGSFIEFDEHHGLPSDSVFSQVKLTSWLPTASGLQPSRPGESLSPDRPELRTSSSTGRRTYGKMLQPSASNEKLQSSQLRIARPAVRYLSRWFSDESYFHNLGMSELMDVKRWLTYQLAEIDWFLSSRGDDAICAASNLVAIGSVKYGVVQYTRLSKRFVMPETLEAFNLTWTADPDDQTCLIVKGYLDRETLQRLFAYTKNYIDKNHAKLHTVKCPQLAQGYYYATKKGHRRGNTTNSLGKLSATTADPVTHSNTESSGETALADPREADIKYTSVIDTVAIEPKSSTSLTDTTTPVEHKPAPGSPATTEDVKLREWAAQDRRRSSGEDEVAVKIDPLVSALEALAFFRASIFGALLATGTDTSLLLSSDKRYQLVQLQ